jgi:hypothetical protein
MGIYLIRRERVLLSLILLVSALLIFPSNAFSAGTIKLNKNAVLNITQADSESKGGGPLLRPAGFVIREPNASYVNKSTNTLKAAAAVGVGEVKYWAKLSTQFTVARGDNTAIYGRARVTVYGGHYKGCLQSMPGPSSANVSLHMNVADQQKDTDEGASILLGKVAGYGDKTLDKDFEKSLELTVIAGRTYNVDLELKTEVSGVNVSAFIMADFYSERKQMGVEANWETLNYGVKYQGIKVTIIESLPPASGPGRYR